MLAVDEEVCGDRWFYRVEAALTGAGVLSDRPRTELRRDCPKTEICRGA
jgi:hypothetical protein